MATVTKWTPFGVALNISATAGTITRTSATQYTVEITAIWNTYYSGAKTNYGMSAISGGVTKVISPFDGTNRSTGRATFTGTYSISGNGSATKSVTVTFRNYNDDNDVAASKAVSLSVKVPAWTSYTVSYDANGGTGAPGSQTKWKSQTLKLSTTTPTRPGYSFLGWATSASGSVAYAAGANYTANAKVTLYAVWEANAYTVSYNANGGTGEPSSQTKEHDTILKLSSTEPKRTNYTFLGWATSASATTATYAAGANYTENTAVTLYAVWKLIYVKPRINNLSVSRCDSSGVESDTGTCVRVKFDYECDQAIDGTLIVWESASGETDELSDFHNPNEDNGSIDVIISSYEFSTEATYSFTVTVTDAAGYSAALANLSGTAFALDFLAGGNGAAFGKPAELGGVLDIAFQTKFRGGIQNEVLEKYNNLNDVVIPNTYVSVNKGATEYLNCPITSGTFILEVMSAGAEGQVFQRLTTTFKETHQTYERHYYQNSWGKWVCVRSDTGWVDLTLQSGIAVGTECGFLKGRLKNGVLYIQGDVTGISANWKYIALVPAALLPDGLGTSTRFGGVYNMSYFCGFNLTSGGQLYVSTNSAGTWDGTKNVSVNITLCGG